MTLDQLRAFVAVAEREHLTRAAEHLHLTASAVSSAIRTLEERYGAPLFHRVGRGLELSEAGRIFLGEARAILARTDAAELVLSELGGLRRGAVAIHASQTIASYWLPPFLLRFRENWPALDVRLQIGNTAGVVAAITDGVADIGFVEGEVDDPHLTRRIVGKDQLIVVVRPSHPWATVARPGPEHFTAGPWIMREQGSGTRSAFEAALRAAGLAPHALPVAMELPSNEAILTALQSTDAAAALSELATRPHLDSGRLVRLPFVMPPRNFALLRHRERHRTKASLALEALIDPPQ